MMKQMMSRLTADASGTARLQDNNCIECAMEGGMPDQDLSLGHQIRALHPF